MGYKKSFVKLQKKGAYRWNGSSSKVDTEETADPRNLKVKGEWDDEKVEDFLSHLVTSLGRVRFDALLANAYRRAK